MFCRTGSYELSEAESVERGTKIVLHLKGDCYDYAKENIVKGIELIYSETCVKWPTFVFGIDRCSVYTELRLFMV